MLIAGSYFPKQNRYTWYHCRYGSGHEIDHVLLLQRDRRIMVGCKTLHFGTSRQGTARLNGPARLKRGRVDRSNRDEAAELHVQRKCDGAYAWEPYTDHEPVELAIKVEHLWTPRPAVETRSAEPHYRKLIGKSSSAEEARVKLGEAIEEKLKEFGNSIEDMPKDILEADL